MDKNEFVLNENQIILLDMIQKKCADKSVDISKIIIRRRIGSTRLLNEIVHDPSTFLPSLEKDQRVYLSTDKCFPKKGDIVFYEKYYQYLKPESMKEVNGVKKIIMI